MLGHPPGSRNMRFIRAVCPIQLLAQIDSQNDQCDLAPVGAFRIRVQQPEATGKMEFIIRSYRGSIGRLIGHRCIWIGLVAQCGYDSGGTGGGDTVHVVASQDLLSRGMFYRSAAASWLPIAAV